MIKAYQFNYKKVGLFSILALLTLYVLSGELSILLGTDPNFERYKSMSWLLLSHALLGSIALVIGPDILVFNKELFFPGNKRINKHSLSNLFELDCYNYRVPFF